MDPCFAARTYWVDGCGSGANISLSYNVSRDLRSVVVTHLASSSRQIPFGLCRPNISIQRNDDAPLWQTTYAEGASSRTNISLSYNVSRELRSVVVLYAPCILKSPDPFRPFQAKHLNSTER